MNERNAPPRGGAQASVEQFREEALFLPVVVVVMVVFASDDPARGRSGFIRRGALDDLFEFPSVKPDASAFGAVIDFYTLFF